MANILKNTLIVSGSTIGSRCLGLLRDILYMALFPLGPLNAAFVAAFTLPNLFRRLMGEGALTSSFVPVLSDTMEKGGKIHAFSFINKIVTRTTAALCAITLIGIACIMVYHFGGFARDEKELWTCKLSYVLFPYLFFICMAALLSGALNVFGRFAVAALSAVWLNLCMIASLFVARLFNDPGQQMYVLCYGVLIGGIIQMTLPWIAMKKHGWTFKPDATGSPEVSHVFKLFVPSVTAASVMQLNVLISRLIALNLDDTSISILYLANRLIELPIGVFTVGLATVFFPEFSRAVSGGSMTHFRDSFYRATRFILAINMAAAVGMVVLNDPITSLLFQWGKFGKQSVEACAPVVAVFALSLPWYSLSTIATRAFHAQKEMKTPMKVAMVSMVLNVLCSFVVVFLDFGVIGLAWANFLSGGFQSAVLMTLLVRKNEHLRGGGFFLSLFKMTIACICMGAAAYGLWRWLGVYATGKFTLMLALFAVIGICATLYFGILYLINFEDKAELHIILNKIRARFRKTESE